MVPIPAPPKSQTRCLEKKINTDLRQTATLGRMCDPSHINPLTISIKARSVLRGRIREAAVAIVTGVRSAGTVLVMVHIDCHRKQSDAIEQTLENGFNSSIKPKCFSPHCSMRRVSWHAIVGNHLSFNPVATTYMYNAFIAGRPSRPGIVTSAKVTQYH